MQTVKLAVVGAHLKDMPLHWQLTSRDAKFVGAFETAPEYRLYAIANSVPPKPALVHSGEGASIAVEVYELGVSVSREQKKKGAEISLRDLTEAQRELFKASDRKQWQQLVQAYKNGGWRWLVHTLVVRWYKPRQNYPDKGIYIYIYILDKYRKI